ncbi:MAG: LysM peptidoglycan-binding domain-containing protein [Planctomycetota bacterium]|jgi:nucleoid-associated protein YgaU
MRKDLKIGIVIGIALAIVAIVIMSVWPGTSVEARLKRSRTASAGGRRPAEIVPDTQAIIEVEPTLAEPQSPVHKDIASPAEQFLDEIETVEAEENFKPQPESLKAQGHQEMQIHVVAGGETLSSISLIYYASAAQWKKILDANPKVITDENRLQPGMRLVIPR